MNNIKDVIRRINVNLSNEKNGVETITFLTPDSMASQHLIIANLAMMYGQSGERVLIVDTDFSREVFPRAFKLKHVEKGLSDYLNTKMVSIKSIKNSVENQNIDIISSGTLTSEETEYLIEDPNFKILMENEKKQYDKIFINTRAFNRKLSLDSILNESDGVILVESLSQTPKKKMYRLIETLKKRQIKIIGYVNAGR